LKQFDWDHLKDDMATINLCLKKANNTLTKNDAPDDEILKSSRTFFPQPYSAAENMAKKVFILNNICFLN
jgi:hypothetical protein